jgi:hypothetical protein
VRAQIERHQPALLGASASIPDTVEMPALARHPRLRFARLRRFRRAA